MGRKFNPQINYVRIVWLMEICWFQMFLFAAKDTFFNSNLISMHLRSLLFRVTGLMTYKKINHNTWQLYISLSTKILANLAGIIIQCHPSFIVHEFNKELRT